MINLQDFTNKEKQGLVSLVRITEDALAISSKKFDPTTGEELAEEVVGGNISEYKEKVLQLKAEIKDIEAFIVKFEALKPQN